MPRIDSDIQLVGTDIRNHAGKGNRCKLANRRESDTLLLAVGRRRENVGGGRSQKRHRRGLGAYWDATPAPQSVTVSAHTHSQEHMGRKCKCVFSAQGVEREQNGSRVA